jgi:hypothetical protein
MIQARENWFRPVRTSIAYPLFLFAEPVWICKPLLRELLADSDLLDNRFVALGVVGFEVVEQAATPADHHEKAAARAVVFLVQFEVFRQLANPLAEQRDLDFRTAGIGSMRSVLSDEGLLMFGG